MNRVYARHGCAACAELNIPYTTDDTGRKICVCGKRGKILYAQEAFDMILYLQDELGIAREFATPVVTDLNELYFENDEYNEELNDWELDD